MKKQPKDRIFGFGFGFELVRVLIGAGGFAYLVRRRDEDLNAPRYSVLGGMWVISSPNWAGPWL
jgi:hypothetical protein